MSQTKAQLLDNIKDNVQLDARNSLRFADTDSSHYVAFKAPATVSSNVTWTLPAADGSANYVLATDGSGNLSWIADPAGQWVTSGSNIYFTGGNVGIGDSSPSNPLSVTGVSAFNGDVTFTGASYNATWDKSADSLIFNDNAKAYWGTDSDLRIQHTGTHGYIDNETGNLYIRNDGDNDDSNIYIQAKNGEESIICHDDGEVQLYFNGNEKLNTVTDGVNITGSLQFADDANTHLSRAGTDILVLTTAGSERLRVDASGRVGIGTTNPQVEFHIADASPIFRIQDTTNNFYAHISADDAGNLVLDGDAGDGSGGSAVIIKTDGSERARFTVDGQLLIGHTSSQSVYSTSALQIQGTSAPTSSLSLLRQNGSPYLSLGATGGGTKGGADAVSSGDRLGQVTFVGADGTDVNTHACSIAGYCDGSVSSNVVPGRLVFKTSSGAGEPERMRIDSSGKVGIGTSSPDELLHLAGGAPNIKLHNTGSSASADDVFGKIVFQHADSDDAGITAIIQCVAEDNAGNSFLAFHNGDGGNADERMRIDSSGRILIADAATAANTPMETFGSAILQIATTAGGSIVLGRNDTSVAVDNNIGGIYFDCNDSSGNAWNDVARISCIADGTHADGDYPTRLEFFTTADGASTVTERLRIHNDGQVTIGNDHSGAGTWDGQLVAATTTGGIITIGDTGSGEKLHLEGGGGLGRVGTSSAHMLSFFTNGISNVAMSIDTSQRVLIGHTASMFGDQKLQVTSTSSNGSIMLGRWSNSGYSSYLNFFKSRHTSITDGGGTVVQDGDILGMIAFYGDDGSSGGDNKSLAGSISCVVAGSPGNDDMPGRLVFKVSPEDSETAAEKFHIDEQGARVSGTFEAFPSSTSSVTAGTFYNNSTGASADCRVQIKTYANQGADPYIHFDSGGTNYICGQKWEGTTNNTFKIGAGESPSGTFSGITIDSSGRTMIGTTSSDSYQLKSSAASQAAFFNNSGTGDVVAVKVRHARGGLSGYTGKAISFCGNDDSEEGSIVIGTTATIYNTSSDYRLKENEVAISNGITRLKQLKPYRFNFKKDKSVTVDGFFAHEVSSVVPEAISGAKDAMAAETRYEEGDSIPSGKVVGDPKTFSSTKIEPQGIDHSKLVPLLTAALQEAITKIETLETKVAALESA